ncbi:alpha-amylase [Niastella koreensis]|uniref:Alpha amylase catalytic region n=2 Tax=Niastella koreensis TaxID=354356 RepID=G8T779_NIAKG|nr:alpha-amylase family glycosyl hydrolase [Niastella koreensis]AEW00104.1 alpha amylase catalytic region [Niastella koreensis GR20-10]OQP49588.1 alpha-amylase [Niastella koreensis]
MNWIFYSALLCLMAGSAASCNKNSGLTTATQPATADVPAGASDGVTFTKNGTSAIFNLYAPGKNTVAVIGEFNNWKPTAMTQSTDGNRWWVQVDNLDPAKEYAYQYLLDDTLKVADPYTHKILDPDNDAAIPSGVYPALKAYPSGTAAKGMVSVMQANPAAYTWKVGSFTRPDPKNLVVYELLVRDFVATHSYATLTDTLNYLATLGVNAIELLPVNEFEGNDSWGYNTNFLFALDKYYGTPNSYKAFIDACHARGIAVIQDIVLEDQFGSSPMVRMYATASGSPSAKNPWFNETNRHPYAVGYQLNHESAATVAYTEYVLKYWMQEYHIDGFRFDQSKGFTQTNSGNDAAWSAYDAGRVAIWTKYIKYMQSLDAGFYIILEHFAADQEEAALAGLGAIMWNNLNGNANQATMSYNDAGGSWDLKRMFYDSHGFTTPYNLMTYIESHDEERLQYKNEQYGNYSGSYRIKDLATGLARQQLIAAFEMAAPGPKMLWQFGELGYDVSIDYNGRTGSKPIYWNYAKDASRLALYNTYAKLINLKKKNSVFTATNYSYKLDGAVKTISLTGSDGTSVMVVGNFDVVAQTPAIAFPLTGTWYDDLSGGTVSVTATPYTITLAPGEYHIYSNTMLKQ